MNKVRFYKEHKQYLLQIDDSKSVVALPWALTNIPTISELSIDNVMQHLTSMEADLAMLNWFDCLTLQSHIQVVVPDADYFMRMWLDADWTKTTLLTKTSLFS